MDAPIWSTDESRGPKPNFIATKFLGVDKR
jgi:hypothetical protein